MTPGHFMNNEAIVKQMLPLFSAAFGVSEAALSVDKRGGSVRIQRLSTANDAYRHLIKFLTELDERRTEMFRRKSLISHLTRHHEIALYAQ